jgi:hypothetical protein
MPAISRASTEIQKGARDRSGERGAALLTALLISLLLLAAGGALIMTTALAATSTIDSTAEQQAYYAAEAGLQESLAVLRGHTAPRNPANDTTDYITYTQAVANSGTLSKWLTYSNTFGGNSRVVLTDPTTYSVYSGMAFATQVTDPDNVSRIEFTVSGIFPNSTKSNKSIIDFGGGSDKATVTYTAPAAATGANAINGTGNTTLGSFAVSGQNGLVTVDEPFNLTITQTAPYAQTLVISCRLQGNITALANTVALVFPTQVNNIGGVIYSRSALSFPVSLSGNTTLPVTVTAPEPYRVKVQSTGYGPRGAKKQLQMLVSRFGFDFKPNAAITIRSDDSDAQGTYRIGDSSKYKYNGNDNSGGASLPAFAVTGTNDYTYITGLIPNATQVQGLSPISKVNVSDLPTFLQTPQAARDFLNVMRGDAYNSNSSLNRYFTSCPSTLDFGASTKDGLLTFIDGDCALPPAGGKGILIVTGTLDMRGSADFKGIVLVLGKGELYRDGGGGDVSLGSIVVARFDSTGTNFLAPTFDTNGAGGSSVRYDSQWVDKALKAVGPRVMGVSEY